MTITTCPVCKKEYNRNLRLGRPSYCSRECSGKGNAATSLQNLGTNLGNIDNIPMEKRLVRKKDQWSPFREVRGYYLYRFSKRG